MTFEWFKSVNKFLSFEKLYKKEPNCLLFFVTGSLINYWNVCKK